MRRGAEEKMPPERHAAARCLGAVGAATARRPATGRRSPSPRRNALRSKEPVAAARGRAPPVRLGGRHAIAAKSASSMIFSASVCFVRGAEGLRKRAMESR
jgi:hypothetical protein